MNRISLLVASGAVSVAMLVVPAFASAAAPTKGASYNGLLYANSVQALSKKIVIKVSATGTRASNDLHLRDAAARELDLLRDQEGRQLQGVQ